MTRAIERLIVCGCDGMRGRPERCWYDLVCKALTPSAQRVSADDGDGEVWRYLRRDGGADKAGEAKRGAGALTPARPSWLDLSAPEEPGQAVALSPSRAYEDEVRVHHPPSGTDRKTALARGTALHRLLQSLPELAPDARAEAARRHLAKARDLSPDDRSLVLQQVLAILDDAQFSALFRADSRAEVPIVGRLTLGGRTIAVSGQVDRLMVTPAGVLIADFKTNRPAPRRLADVPRAYVRQLALYRAVLAQLYPDVAVRAALIWTEIPALVEIPAAEMDREMAALTEP
jgi:ATP-dependent helicase/nuclease subunit A